MRGGRGGAASVCTRTPWRKTDPFLTIRSFCGDSAAVALPAPLTLTPIFSVNSSLLHPSPDFLCSTDCGLAQFLLLLVLHKKDWQFTAIQFQKSREVHPTSPCASLEESAGTSTPRCSLLEPAAFCPPGKGNFPAALAEHQPCSQIRFSEGIALLLGDFPCAQPHACRCRLRRRRRQNKRTPGMGGMYPTTTSRTLG